MASLGAPPAKIVLCADDFALNPGVSSAILALVDKGRLSAVSGLTTMQGWREQAKDLALRADRVAIGLHLDLSARPFSGARPAYPIGALLWQGALGRLDVADLAKEFERQFDAFEEAVGRAPDHVDGHHHVHVFLQIRDALVATLSRRYAQAPIHQRPLVRIPSDSARAILARRAALHKALFVAAMSAGLRERLRREGFPCNEGFSGFSRFGKGRSFDEELDLFLKSPGRRHMIMCHPGLAETKAGAADPLVKRRREEEEYETLLARADLPSWLFRVERRGGEANAFAQWLEDKTIEDGQ